MQTVAKTTAVSLVSQVAAGICQGIKNPLSTVRQFLQLFESKEKYKADKKAYELVIEELDRAEDIISTFSLLACKKDEIMKLQSLNDNIVQVFPLIMQEAEKNKVFIKLELSEAAPIMMDESEIRQLLHNLVRNGMEAMQNGGILTVGTFQDKNGVNLVVKDKGTGIPEDVMEKIATPFFTTKERRIGLGLSVCYSIVDRHNAQIDIKSSPEGTCVNVVFPAAAKAANSQTGKSAPA
ncbi:MAG TPA: HAMP domain-containing sensor histidine kinase [Syntrophomonas sp.]|nr:HAMP domain-containing sensor histidine kinase [Syntrophomonas sp.]